MSGEGAEVAYPLFQGEGGGSSPTSPLQFKIEKIGMNLALRLNKKWHSRLPLLSREHLRIKHGFAYGSFYNWKIYAVAIWSDPIARVFNGKRFLELRRFAISNDSPKNTASRMLKIMQLDIKKNYPLVLKLISYQDIDVHCGTIYKASGWKVANVSQRNQLWTKSRPTNNKGTFFGKYKKGSSKEQTTSPKVRWEKDL